VTGNLISVSNTITAGSFIVGNTYVIATVGTTDFTLIGAASNTVGVRFTATGVGAGDGTATTFTGRAVNVTGVVAVDNGGTGATSLNPNSVVTGGSTSTGAVATVRPGTLGNVLSSTAGSTVTAGSFVVGNQYSILTLGTTTNAQWNTIAGTSAVTYVVGSTFTCADIGTGLGDGTAQITTWTSAANNKLTSMTAQATTSGTAKDFTGIPSWVKRITVIFNGVSSTGNNTLSVQLGTSSGIETTGYDSLVATNRGVEYRSSTNLIVASFGSTTNTTEISGAMTIFLVSGTTFVSSTCCADVEGTNERSLTGGGNKTLASALTQLRVLSTVAFDAGSVNVMYE
jgi:hypothetical protein